MEQQNNYMYNALTLLLESAVALYVGMPRKQNGHPIHFIVKSSPQNTTIGKFNIQ